MKTSIESSLARTGGFHGDGMLDEPIGNTSPQTRHRARVAVADQVSTGRLDRDDVPTVLQALGLMPYDVQPPPVKSHTQALQSRGKVPDDTVRALRDAYAAGGTTYGRLAEQYGLTVSTTADIVSRKTYRHVAESV